MTPRMERLTSTRMSRKLLQALQSVSASSAYNVRDNEVARGGAEEDGEHDDTQQNGKNDIENVDDEAQSSAHLDESVNASGTNNCSAQSQSTATPSSFPSSLMALAKFVRHNSLTGSAASSPVPPQQPETLKCSVYFLDDTQHLFELDRSAKGEELLELVFRHLELIEREYFALQFSETVFHHHPPYSGTMISNSFGTTVTRYNRWLDPSKKIRKQLRFTKSPFSLYFRVKFYVTEMARLFEEYTRYHFYLQIRKDIFDGRLSGPESTMALLASYVLQSDLGDYSPEEHPTGYCSGFSFIPNQTEDFEKKVSNLHKMHTGQTPADSELNYLEEAKKLEFYGVDLHQARDAEANDIQIGVSGSGLTVFRNLVKLNTFSWAKIVKISFKRRFFFIQLKHEGTERFDNVVGFNLCSYRACKSLWKSCVEQHTFFRLHTPKPLTKKFFFFFSLGSKFRYSGKTEFQTIEENKRRLTRTERIFIRNSSKMLTHPRTDVASQHLANLRMTSNLSAPATNLSERCTVKFELPNGNRASKSRSSSSASSTEDVESSASLPLNGSSAAAMGVAARNKYCLDKSSALSLIVSKASRTLPYKSTNTSIKDAQQSTKNVCQSVSFDNLKKKNAIHENGRGPCENSSLGLVQEDKTVDDSYDYELNGRISDGGGCVDNNYPTTKTVTDVDGVTCAPSTRSTSAAYRSHNVEIHQMNQQSARELEETCLKQVETKNSSKSLTTTTTTTKQQQYSMDSPIRDLINELYEKGINESSNQPKSTNSTFVTKLVQHESSTSSSSNSSPVHLVTIRIKPDSEGRFGFNFKGGSDQNCDILISRVVPNTPADKANPVRLNEGDEVLIINGKDVKGLKHDEVVDLIRSTNDSGDHAELCLVIRPLGIQVPLEDDDNPPNPGFIYTIQSGSSLESPLEISMNLLDEGLDSEKILAEFEQLSRRDERETITLARAMENIPKNRYLDIAPYDSTRVVLEECITGDYINASYVTTRIESTDTTNRYIATQGPLKRTMSDFWQMIWEQKCSVIVMVTPLVEDGRKKCYKYWPEVGETSIINERLQLTQQDCQDEIAFLQRTFHLHDPQTGEEHQIKHLQYLAWPDQGIPDDDSDFLKLISRVRQLRTDSPEAHVVVHCSAGIGRTGVLILMETGICKIEANEPLYPLDLVRIMRTQRAMLIQTTMQFFFVCQALFHVWRDKVVVPLNKPSEHTAQAIEQNNDDITNESIHDTSDSHSTASLHTKDASDGVVIPNNISSSDTTDHNTELLLPSSSPVSQHSVN